MMKVMNERTLNSASSMKIPFLHQPAGSRFKGQSSGGMVFPCTGRTYYTHFPFLYTPPHRTARKAVPPRLSEGAAHKKAAAPGEERVRLPSGLCRRQDRRRAIPANRPPRRSLRKGWGGRGWFRRDRGLCSHAGWRGWFRRSDRKRGLRRCARRGACRCLLQRRA